MVAVRYLSRRIGRSQNGMADGSSLPRPLADPLPPSAGAAGGAAGLGLAAGRCRAPAPDHPVDGQAGAADPAGPVGPARPEGAGPGDVERAREPAAPGAAERPAPRDQPEAALAGPAGDAPLPDRGGRSSGGAARAPLSASGAFRLRVRPAAAAPRRDPELASPFPSTAGGASGRNRDAYASPLPA
jgi:hypothetical protein